MELSGHSQTFYTQVTGVAHGKRKVQVTPPARRQRLQLEVGVSIDDGAVAGPDVSSVVKNCAVLAKTTYKGSHVTLEGVNGLYGEITPVIRIGWIGALRYHLCPAVSANTP